MRASLLAAALVAATVGCVEFVDPVGLRLAEPTIISVTMELQKSAGACVLPPAASPGPERTAVLCVRGILRPGRDRFGARRAVLDPTLRVMGVPLEPALSSDSALLYERGYAIAADRLADTVYTVALPSVEGVALPTEGIRWTAVERVGADTISVDAEDGVALRVRAPGAADDPEPTFTFWQASLVGETSAIYSGLGVAPRETYRFSADVVQTLGDGPLRGFLRWRRQYIAEAGPPVAQVVIDFVQTLEWTVLPAGTQRFPR